jgi:transposase
LPRIQKLIQREFHVTYHPNYLSRLMDRLGFSLQQPLPRARERDEALVRAWLAHDWPRIKKSAAERAENRVFR